MGSVSSYLGEDEKATQSGLDSVLPSLMGGLISKGSSNRGALDLFDLIGKPELSGGLLDNIGDLFGGGDVTKSNATLGESILSMVFW